MKKYDIIVLSQDSPNLVVQLVGMLLVKPYSRNIYIMDNASKPENLDILRKRITSNRCYLITSKLPMSEILLIKTASKQMATKKFMVIKQTCLPPLVVYESGESSLAFTAYNVYDDKLLGNSYLIEHGLPVTSSDSNGYPFSECVVLNKKKFDTFKPICNWDSTYWLADMIEQKVDIFSMSSDVRTYNKKMVQELENREELLNFVSAHIWRKR